MSILSTIDPSLLRRAAGACVARPGEYGDLFAERTMEATLARADGVPETPVLGISEGAAARVFDAERVRHVAVASLDPDAILELPHRLHEPDAMPPGRRSKRSEAAGRAERIPPRWMDGVARHLEAIEAAVAARRAPGPLRVGSKAELTSQRVVVATSEGEVSSEERHWISFSIGLAGDSGAAVVEGGGASDLERLRTLHPPDAVAARLERGLLESAQAAPAPSGEMNVIIGPGAGGILIHEACGHALEGDRALRGRSAFVAMLGERVGRPELTVVDDPTLPGLAGSRRIDDEGWPSARNVLIDSGRIAGLLLDRTTALLAATTPTGSARRQSYRDLPIPRMSNTFVAGGRHLPEEILASVRRGLYVAELGAGEVDTVSADFSFRVRRGYLIADGRLVVPLRPFLVRGNGLRVLRDIQMVGVDLSFDGGSGECGKEGQRSRAAVGQPTIKVAGLAVQPEPEGGRSK